MLRIRPIAALAVVAFGLLAVAAGGSSATKATGFIPPEDDWPADPDILRESACSAWAARATGDTPRTVAVRVAKGLWPDGTWPSPMPNAKARLAEIEALITAVEAGEIVCNPTINPTPVPTPGGFYQVEQGDVLLGNQGLMAQAYPWLTSGQRPEAVRLVRDHPRNAGIVVPTLNAGNQQLIGDTIISMFPDWRCAPQTEQARFDSGKCYAVIYFPILASLS